MKAIDNFLNKITMYKIVLYVLIMLVLVAISLSAIGLLPYSPLAIVFSAFLILSVSLITNIVFAYAFDVPANVESVYITALILVLIITPIQAVGDTAFYSLAIWASVLSMASKYILAIKHKHIFNPAGIAVVITAVTLFQSATWWIGTAWMLPFVLIGGFLITRKIHRFDLVISFCITAILMTIIPVISNGGNLTTALWRIVATVPLFFFATVMLTEPLTTPPTKWLRVAYGIFVGLLFAPNVHVGTVYSTPELALVVGNVFSYLVSPKEKLTLKLREIREVARDTYDFIFTSNRKMVFVPGQYLEWTIPDKGADTRGNRRYFTIASSPTEPTISIGVKFYPEASSFKKMLLSMQTGDTIIASQRAGDFTMPKDTSKKLVFVAGGIGVTPFRSMIKYLIDKGEKRDIVIFYSNKSIEDIAYADLFAEAYTKLGIRTVCTLTDTKSVPSDWQGNTGYVNYEMIMAHAPDFRERTFYISGPHSMVTAFDDTIRKMGILSSQIKKDFFPGFV